MNRKDWIQKAGVSAASLLTLPGLFPPKRTLPHDDTPALTVAHITDVHIRPEKKIPVRFRNCLDDLFSAYDIDLVLNGGDTIHAADYDHITRQRVLDQWEAWDGCAEHFGNTPVCSCLGNHDMWWAAPDKQDPMYGKPYVIQRLNMPGRYYSFSEAGWTFLVLDGNNDGICLDAEQMTWLRQELESLPRNHPVLIMSHHPILSVTGAFYPDDLHSDADNLTRLFYRHRDKVKCCISGHMHLLDEAVYNGTTYYCNGAASGYWWGKGDRRSAGKGYYRETPPGIVLLSLYSDGRTERFYCPFEY